MEPFKKIVVLQNAFEAERMELILSEHGIPYRIRSYHDSAYDGLFQAVKGWGHVEAPEEHKDQIKALYNQLPGEPAPPDPDQEARGDEDDVGP